MSRDDGWDEDAETRQSLDRVRRELHMSRLARLFRETPEAPADVAVVFTVEEAEAAYVALKRFSAMLALCYDKSEPAGVSYEALLAAREKLYQARQAPSAPKVDGALPGV